MGWSNLEEHNHEERKTSSKLLLAIIVCVALIVIIIGALLYIQLTSFKLTISGKLIENYDKSKLLTQINNVTYVSIEEFSKLVGYEYHKGEYKAFTIDDDKCYVEGPKETASFFLNDNRVCKLPVDEITQEYKEISIEKAIKEINGEMYAPLEAINLAFNVVVKEGDNSLDIYTLDYLVKQYDAKVKQWGYTGIAEQDFENQKALLYGRLIVKKKDGLYKIITSDNKEEIVSDKYNAIQFLEDVKEFFVTNSLEQVGIINLDGTTKVEPIYESVSVLNSKLDLYLVQKEAKYGVVKSGNIDVIKPEYDSIGITSTDNTLKNSKYLILDNLIPVCKDNKWGAFNTKGDLIFKIEYDGIGCDSTIVDINGIEKTVKPVLSIKECNGIVVKQGEKYGLLRKSGEILVPLEVDYIYSIEDEAENTKYYMLYNNEEINIIDRLTAAGLLGDKNTDNNTNADNMNNNTIIVNIDSKNNITLNNSVR